MFSYIIFIVLILFLALEFYMRFFTSYCEPYFDKETKIVKRKKNTEGVYETLYTNTGYFRINNEGWNSHREYLRRQEDNRKLRIAIVGHSNIEGLRVPIDRTLSKILEGELNNKGLCTEVYTFGYGGMHLVQALHVSRYVNKNFQPDILIIGTFIDNFLNETTDKSNFLSLSIDKTGHIKEVVPQKYQEENNSPLSVFYFSKLIKYADLRFRLGKKIRFISSGKYDENIRKQNHYKLLNDSIYEQKILLSVEYILKEFKELQQNSQPQIYFINLPLNIPSFNYYEKNLRLNSHHEKIIEQISNHHFLIINVEQALLDDYQQNHQKFDFPNDGHYNEYAHYVIGKCLADYFITVTDLK